ncbi:MAG: peptidylprolyl isomerase [Georgfuchsia sp.]
MKLRHLFPLLLALLLPVTAHSVATPIIPADRVIAVVNNEAITEYDLKQRLTVALQQLRAQNIQPPSEDVMVKQVLESLIMERIQLQYAKETGLSISDSDLDATIRRIAESNKASVTEMKAAIERDGINWDRFRHDIREQVILSRVREREVDNRVNVSDGEIDNYLANPPAVESGKVNIAHILIRVPEQASPEQLLQLRARAEQALAQIKAGEDFGKVVATFSDAPDALTGGVVGLRPVDSLPPLFGDVLGKLQPGETSEILRSPAGFHIIKLIERQDAKQGLPALKQTHARHILIRINELTSEADARHKLNSIKERLDHGANFAELARLYSDDLSASKGGDLGWLYQGDTVPEFERAMDELGINEISQPVQTPFGLHLIQVLERRVDEGSKERQRMVARMALRERKADEAYQDWLRQQRDQAYVEYRLDEK